MDEYIKNIRKWCFAYDRRMQTAPKLMSHFDCLIAEALFLEMDRLKTVS